MGENLSVRDLILILKDKNSVNKIATYPVKRCLYLEKNWSSSRYTPFFTALFQWLILSGS